jgi:hypothetical protein
MIRWNMWYIIFFHTLLHFLWSLYATIIWSLRSTPHVTTSVHTISNRKLSATYLTKRNAGNNVNPQVRVNKLDGRKERHCVICSDRKRNIREFNMIRWNMWYIIFFHTLLHFLWSLYATIIWALRSTPIMNVLYAHMILGLPFNVLVGYGRKERHCVICSDRKRNIRRRSQTSCARCTRGLHAAWWNNAF